MVPALWGTERESRREKRTKRKKEKEKQKDQETQADAVDGEGKSDLGRRKDSGSVWAQIYLFWKGNPNM